MTEKEVWHKPEIKVMVLEKPAIKDEPRKESPRRNS